MSKIIKRSGSSSRLRIGASSLKRRRIEQWSHCIGFKAGYRSSERNHVQDYWKDKAAPERVPQRFAFSREIMIEQRAWRECCKILNPFRLSFTSSLYYNSFFVFLAFIIIYIFTVLELRWYPSWMLPTKRYLDLDLEVITKRRKRGLRIESEPPRNPRADLTGIRKLQVTSEYKMKHQNLDL